MRALEFARWRAAVGGVPESIAVGSALVGAVGRWIRYVPLAAAGIVMIAAVLVGTTTVFGLAPETTWMSWPGHGFLTRTSRAAGPLTSAAVVIAPSCTCTCTFERCCRKIVPSAFQPGGTAGAMRSRPS